MTLFDQIRDIIKSITESVSEMETLIEIAGLCFGIVVAGWQAFISLCSILSSNNIEIALMSKRERVKLNATSMATFIIALWFFNLLCSHMAVSFPVNESMIACGIISILALGVALITIILLIFLIWLFKKLYNIHAWRFICAIFRKILIKIRTGIKKKAMDIRREHGQFANKIKDCEIVVKIGSWCSKCREWFILLWKNCERDENNRDIRKRTFEQQLRIMVFLITIAFGVIFNYVLAVYANGYKNIYILSTLVTILILEIAISFLNFQVAPEDSRIFYYDDTWKKYIFIYFRQDEAHCIGGDADILRDCNELFLVPYEKIEKQKLYSISKWKQDRVNIDNKRIHLQHEQNELMMNEVFDKIKNELQSKAIVPELMERTDIYIKPEDKKAYYVLADGTKGDIDL